ncbi:MAG: PilZ domain-containing protein [Elusimicrobia bacterium]|nr:PilZ domain-containing protein [Elusimicrobiota bacterium]
MEKRRRPRVPTSILIDVNEVGSAVTKHRGHVADLSITGLALDTSFSLDIGASLFLKIDIPIEVKGKIVRAQKKAGTMRYGVRFQELGFFEKQRLKKYITAHFKK